MTPPSRTRELRPGLTPAVAAGMKLSVSSLRTSPGRLWWVEGRPDRGGQRVVVSRTRTGEPEVVSPVDLSLGSRLHEYGGGELAVTEDQRVIGVRAADQSLISFSLYGNEEEVLVDGDGDALGEVNVTGEWVTFVRERHGEGGPRRSVWLLNLGSRRCSLLLEGPRFFSHVRLDPEASRLVWCTWSHPFMSWESAEVWIAPLHDGSLGEPVRVGGGVDGAATHPRFLHDGSLVFLEERGGFPRPVRRAPSGETVELGRPGIEYGGPIWVVGEDYVAEVNGELFAVEQRAGLSHLVRLEGTDSHDLGGPMTSIVTVQAFGDSVAWMGSTASSLGAVGWCSRDGENDAVCALGPASPLGAEEISKATPVSCVGRDGVTIHGLLFLPPRRLSESPPPVIVACHGGPTAQARAGFDPMVQLFTSSGFAVVAANYAGSTGFGAAYRHRLEGQWGVADVADCVDLVSALGKEGVVDSSRAAIRGGSAGGFTALLAGTTGAFRCVVSWYGVADLLTLVATTHDFELHYTDSLVGPLPEAHALYVERSPVSQASSMTSAVLLLQGLEDPVVPPSQAEAMAEALAAAGRDVVLRFFEGEGHGFRKIETLTAAFTAELEFYQRHLHSPEG